MGLAQLLPVWKVSPVKADLVAKTDFGTLQEQLYEL